MLRCVKVTTEKHLAYLDDCAGLILFPNTPLDMVFITRANWCDANPDLVKGSCKRLFERTHVRKIYMRYTDLFFVALISV